MKKEKESAGSTQLGERSAKTTFSVVGDTYFWGELFTFETFSSQSPNAREFF